MVKSELAINGGIPVREKYIPISKPLITEKEINAVTKVLESGMLAQGEQVAFFETEFADYLKLGSYQTVAVNSGTAALIIALEALGINPGDEIITTPFTFIASANAILAVGAIPIFVDVHHDTFLLNERLLTEKLTSRTKGIMPVHLYGLTCEMTPILEIAEQHDLIVIEDAAQAHGAKYRGRYASTLGDAGIFSFYPTKNMTTGEGGLIVCKDKELAERCRSIRDHGQKIINRKVVRYHHQLMGYNWRMTDISAAIGRVQLKQLERFNAIRRRNAELLDKGLRCINGIEPPHIPSHCDPAYHLYGAKYSPIHLGRPREDFIMAVQKEGVGVRGPYPIPVYRQDVYQKINDVKVNRWAKFIEYPDYNQVLCPVTEKLTKTILEIPIHHCLSEKDMEDVIEALSKVANNYGVKYP
ncbi:MAG: DegT/DnrJ/EryC1/StrS family aminotransferase [Candidatus Ranarchaeia archaeon]